MTEPEIKELSDVLYQCIEEGYGCHQRDLAISYLATRPHLLFSEGYDEARIFSSSNAQAHSEVAKYLRRIEISNEVKSEPFKGAITQEAILRNSVTGAWDFLYYIWGEDPADEGPLTIGLIGPRRGTRKIKVDAFLLRLAKRGEGTVQAPAMVLPHIWIPPSISREKILISSVSFDLMRAIHEHRKPLRSLHWRELEEIVAGLLEMQGLNVKLTPKTRDGGRDILATGEFLPGLKCTLAVEVTSSPHVGITKLSQALYRNRNFPLVMVATSGSFTTGVYQEAGLPEHHLRLFLRDGNALNRWISDSLQEPPGS